LKRKYLSGYNAMKKVWILNHYASGLGGSTGTRHFHLARNLRKYGWQASVIAASVEHVSGLQRLPPGENWRLDIQDGIPFLWLRTPAYSGNGAGRVINMLAFVWRALSRSSTAALRRPDVITGSSVHPFAAVAAAWLATRYRVPFVFEVRDLWPQTLIDLGRLKERGIVTYALRLMERWLYRRASRIVTLLPRAVDYIEPLNIPARKVIWISNGVNIEEFPDLGPGRHENSEPFTLMYFGAHGLANGLDVLIKALAIVKQAPLAPRIRLRLIGNGPLKQGLQQLSVDLGLTDDWISFETPVLKEDIPRIANEADAFVITVRDAPRLYKYGISMNKLFEYLAARRPVLIASAASNNPVKDANCGITVAPDDPQALADGIIKLAKLPYKERESMGQRGRQHVESYYSYDKLAEQFAHVLEECVDEWKNGSTPSLKPRSV
jgi:glycosyltransferase involved in cell wall biosynthesis